MQISTSVVWCSDVVVNIHFLSSHKFPLLLLFALLHSFTTESTREEFHSEIKHQHWNPRKANAHVLKMLQTF